MAYVLHIDTSTDTGTVALSRGGQVLAQQQTTGARDHAATINTMIAQVLGEAGIAMKDIDAVAVCGGPGSYTGLRIGLATAKGICFALDKPLLMHNKLQLLTLQQLENHPGYERYAALLPARAEEYFVAIYDKNGNGLVTPVHVAGSELNILLPADIQSLILTGDLTDGIKEIYSSSKNKIVPNQTIDLNYWARLCEVDILHQRYANTALAAPFYLKGVFMNTPKTRL